MDTTKTRQEQLQEYATKINELGKEYNVTLEGYSGVRIIDLTPKEEVKPETELHEGKSIAEVEKIAEEVSGAPESMKGE